MVWVGVASLPLRLVSLQALDQTPSLWLWPPDATLLLGYAGSQDARGPMVWVGVASLPLRLVSLQALDQTPSLWLWPPDATLLLGYAGSQDALWWPQ